jgi:Bacterial archaeo-eukaryotic release factor family 3
MNKVMTPELKEVLAAVHYRPAVSIIFPFEPKMGLKTELAYKLKIAADKVEKELKEYYPGEMAQLVINKLNAVIKNLNFNTHKKSIAIYISPVFEKVLYLDIAVEEKIIVDESFEIRDLVYSKKQMHKYLVLVVSGKESRIFLGNSKDFVRIVSNHPESVNAYVNEVPERVANFSDMADRKDVITEKFLLHVDKSLGIILNSYRFPLFVLGPDRILGHFKKLTKHAGDVIEFVAGNYDDAGPQNLKEILSPHVADWNKVKQKDILNQIEQAAGNKKLAVGMKEVWQEAMNHKGRLLVVEKNYMYAAEHGSREEVIYQAKEPYNKYSYIRDAVDDVIEKVLETGGDVEFVDEGLMADYNQIALVLFYE